jgi:hypothetical protein
MAKITISVNPRTGGSYFPKEIRRAGFCGKIDGYLNLLTCLLMKPGSTLTDVQRSLRIILDDVALRKDGEENMNKVEAHERFELETRQMEVGLLGIGDVGNARSQNECLLNILA